MAPSKDPSPERQAPEDTADLAQAYRDLARGEQAASALEANLSNLESRLDALLAAIESGEAQNGDQAIPEENHRTETRKPAEEEQDKGKQAKRP